ncbi:MAG: MG2 domain-containing protein, partial [Verrucomicrobia bacterium]|nr:MG2 domain-containing protein [Verrucomicrobiota bacterium]
MGPNATDLPLGRFGIYSSARWPSEETSTEKTNLDGLVFTDRPLYRPGEVVRVKGIVRLLTNHGAKLAPPQNAVFTVTYPHDRGTQKINVNIDAHGAFDTSFELPQALIGLFQINIDPNEASTFPFSTSFQVQEFQPNAFETHLTLPPRFLPAQKVVAHLSANYFFGAPVSDARVQWTLQYSPADIEPNGFERFSFINGELDEKSSGKALTLRGEAKMTAPLAIQPVLPQPTGRRFRGSLTVEVTDQNQQTVTETREFFRDAADFYLGVETTSEYVLRPSQEFVVRAVAVRPDGTPQPTPVPVKAELVRVENDTVRVQTAGQAISFQTERREKVIDTTEGKTLMPALNGESWIAPPGATARFKAVEAGEYFVRLTAHASANLTIQTTSHFMVSSDEPVSWNYRNASQIDLVADRSEYHPGDTARILVKTPISGEAWVSVESGESVLRSSRVKLEGNAPTLEIPIEATDTPNIFVSVVIIRGAEQSTRKFKTADCRYGVCQLRVTDPQTRLQVALTTARPEVQPGQDVSTEVRVLDAKGAPVANAEVTFWAADDGILALTGYTRPQPTETFSRPFSLAITTGITLFDLLPEDPADLTFTNKGYLIGGGGVDGPMHKLRHNFSGTACWFPSLRTDQDGRVKTHFIAPYALTRFRLLAVVHADANRFGSAESSTAQPIKAPLTTKIALENGETRAVDFPVKLVAMGVASWKWSAQMKGKNESFEDKMLTSLQVGSPIPLLRETYLTELREKTNPLLTSVNPQLLEGNGSVTVTLANTRLASLEECAHQLLTYPYGCAEQLASALLPWIVVKNLGPVLGDIGQDPKALRTAIETGVAKIFALQTSNGGLAYWPGGRQSNLFASAWATVVLAELAKENFPLPNDWAKLLGYLGSELRDIRKLRDGNDLDQNALVLFALA